MNALKRRTARAARETGKIIMGASHSTAKESRSYVVSLDNRKARGSGHERPAEIMEAARELFLEHGVEQVTTRQIAARVGISQTALYVYFKTKEAILDRLAHCAWRRLVAALDAVEPAPGDEACPVARLRDVLVVFMRFWLEHPDDYRIVFLRKALRPCVEDDHMLQCVDLMLKRLTDRVEEAVRLGGVRCLGSNQTTALSVWASLSGMVHLRMRFPEMPWPPIAEHVDAMADMILNGCAAKSTAPSHLEAHARIDLSAGLP